ncbi:MAG: suppressor of fused domain protein [Planctomycetes bacterium]|nr:suppressor of fused domain protein [Planctomycetota bacterium]
MSTEDAEQQLMDEWYERKSLLMEGMLGEQHDMVMHAVIPYALGGGLDLYYFPNRLSGVAIATKEVSEIPGEGSSNDVFKCYELVMFTKHSLDLDHAQDESTAFGAVHSNINSILNVIAPYSAEATLNPRETCEFPTEIPRVGGKCMVFNGYPDNSPKNPEGFGLLLIIEIFPSEMNYAREHGSDELFKLLKAKGHYPYSDMDRKPVM